MSMRVAMALTFAVLLALTTASIGLFFALGRDNPRALEITPQKADLEPVFVGESRPFEIQLKNVSSGLVEFRTAMAGCACLNVRIAEPRLEPRESTVLTGALRGRGRAGTFHDEVLVLVAKPQEEAYRIPIQWQVRRRIEVSAESVTLEPDFVSASPGSATVVVRNRSEQAIDLSSPDPRQLPRGIEVVIESPRLLPRQSATVRCRAEADFVTPGNYSVSIPCSLPSEPVVELRLETRPVRAIRVTPPAINWGVQNKAELLTRKLALALEGELLRSCEVKEVKLPAYLVSSGRPQTPAAAKREFAFRVKDAFTAGADLMGDIVVVLRHGTSERTFAVHVPLSGFVLDAL